MGIACKIKCDWKFRERCGIIVCNAPIAQLVEQQPFKLMVVGSIPTGGTNIKRALNGSFYIGVSCGYVLKKVKEVYIYYIWKIVQR